MSTATRILTLPTRLHPGPRAMRYATLASVGALVLSVSLSLFGSLAVRENERDALRTLKLLGAALGAQAVHAATLSEVVEQDPLLERRLRDRRWLAEGRLLLHHGYLFAEDPGGGELRAWPWTWGRTGMTAFAWSDAGTWSHPNPDGRWSGTARAPRRDGRSSDGGSSNGAPSGWVAED